MAEIISESDYESAVTIHDMEKLIFTENDIKVIRNLISYKNNMKFLGVRLFPRIREENVFVTDELQTMRNVFDLVRDDYDYLAIEYQYDLLRRISKAMYDKGMITAGECQTHYRMYNPHSS